MKRCRTPYLIYAVAMLVIFAASRLAFLQSRLGIIAAVLLLYIPLLFLLIGKKKAEIFGMGKKGLWKSAGRALLAAIIIFPLYTAGFYLSMKYVYGFKMSFGGIGLVHDPTFVLWFILNDLFMVAIPEEIFYRGYLESELRRCDGKKVNILGARVGFSFVMVNILFAAGHLIVLHNISRLAVFFPGLVFSWLREKDDNIAGSVLFHWLCNVLSFILLSAI